MLIRCKQEASMISRRPTTMERTSMGITGIPMIPCTVTILTPITPFTAARSCSDSAVADILSMNTDALSINTDALSINTDVHISKAPMDHLSMEGLGMDHLDMGRFHMAEAATWEAVTWEAAAIWAADTGEAATDRSCEHVEQSGLIGVEIEIAALLRDQTMASTGFFLRRAGMRRFLACR